MVVWLAALALVAVTPGTPTPDGPWRQLIRFEPTAEHSDGTSVWIAEDAVLPLDGPSSRDLRTVSELWVAHGAVVGGQAYVVKTNRYDCGQGSIHSDRMEAFARDGRLLGAAGPTPEPGYIQTHSAEAEVERAVCSGSRIAARGATAATVAEAVALAGPERVVEPASVARLDFDYDGQEDVVRIDMRPHSMRHDVEFIAAVPGNREINVVTAHQPPTGPLVQRLIRPLDRDRYLIACWMGDGGDVAPCVPEYVLAQRGVEVVTPGQPTIIVWLTQGEPHVARLP